MTLSFKWFLPESVFAEIGIMCIMIHSLKSGQIDYFPGSPWSKELGEILLVNKWISPSKVWGYVGSETHEPPDDPLFTLYTYQQHL